jgi:hypothetical protein
MSRSITPRLSQHRSESTPHDAVTVDQRSQRHPSFLLALRRQRSSSQRFDGFTSSRFTNLVVQRAARSFTPTRPSMLCRKPIAATAPVQAPHPGSRRQFPIAHAAPPLHRRPRFPALALLGRWLPQRADGLHIPASENLHMRRHSHGRVASQATQDGTLRRRALYGKTRLAHALDTVLEMIRIPKR